MDAISDTEDGILAFLDSKFEADRASLYLGVYGLLQAVYVQQDAVINLCKSLDIGENIKNYPRLFEIREIRNDSVGHPTKRKSKTKDGPTSYHFIPQRSVGASGFDIISMFSNGSSKYKHVDIPSIVLDQQRYISGILSKVIDKLVQEEKEHKDKFRMEKLADIFDKNIHYSFEKITEAIRGTKPSGLGLGSLEKIQKIIHNFREAVKRRDEAYYESFQDKYDLIEHAILKLQIFFQLAENGEVSDEDIKNARIFNVFLYGQVDELKKEAEDIDNDYADG